MFTLKLRNGEERRYLRCVEASSEMELKHQIEARLLFDNEELIEGENGSGRYTYNVYNYLHEEVVDTIVCSVNDSFDWYHAKR